MTAISAANTLVMNIGDMIDMAIGTPENGVVDFNMLQTVLHCLAQQQHILTKPVEVRGVSLPIAVARDNSSTINVTEFAVGTDGKPPMEKMETTPPKDNTMLVVERVKKNESAGKLSAPAPGKSTASMVQAQAARAQALTALPPATAPGQAAGQEGLTLVTYSKFNLLESTVQDLQKRVYGSVPTNETILEEVRSQTNLKAIQDMWTNLNVSARLEAAEIGIGKLSSLIQDIINESAGLQNIVVPDLHPPPPLLPSVSDAAARGAPSTMTTGVGAPSTMVMGLASKADLDDIAQYVNQIRTDLDQLMGLFYEAINKIGVEMVLPPMPEPGPKLEEIMAPRSAGVDAPSAAGGLAAARGPAEAGASPGGPKQSLAAPLKARGAATIDADVLEVMERLLNLEKRVDSCCKTLGKSEGVVSDQLASFQDQLEHLSKQVANLTTMSGAMSPDLIKDLQGLMHLFGTVNDMQDQLKQVHDTAMQLAAEKEDRKHHINVLLEQIELLKTIKLDREDMAEAMAEKADLRMLARKVSHDQFELACDDLSRGLEHALGKLTMQESLWQQALDDIQREIETKLDKLELSPVKEFFNNKLKLLQDSLKQMASLRREAEAAGTKRKLLRDLNCLSCDANAVMATEAPPSIPVPKPFPTALSMKPYLTYELDTIRKTQATNLPQRNMHDWENIDKQMTQQPKQPFKVRSSADKHLCNRYCGGSHTTTTPAQRVARLGHFIKQWGPDVLPLSSGFAAGDDGRMYRVQTEAPSMGPGGAVDTTCTPKAPRKPELPQLSSEKVADDCKCLETPIQGAKK